MSYIKITLLSDMCAGSGESAGNSIDTDICTDSFGIPYIPARRVKGCLRQSALLLQKMGHPLTENTELVKKLFGDEYGNESMFTLQNAVLSDIDAIHEYLKTKAPSEDFLKKVNKPSEITKIFSYVRGQTRLKDGMKVDNSLRFTRVLDHYNPMVFGENKEMEFYAPVYLDCNLKDSCGHKDIKDLLEACCAATRHMGLNRNRGLGNVKVEIHWDEDKTNSEAENTLPESEKTACDSAAFKKITYKVVLDSPLTLVGCGELDTTISSRTVIGCMARQYLREGSAEDEAFKKLFLDGSTRWSALTPVIDGTVSSPAPLILMKLKNGGGKLINRLAVSVDDWKKQKPKTLNGQYAALIKNGEKTEYHVASVDVHSSYHNSVSRDSGLYIQDYIEAGMIYGGTVDVPAALAEDVLKLLQNAKLSFGRSKNAQYASCHLYGTPESEEGNLGVRDIYSEGGEPVIVILKSDMICDNSCYHIDTEYVRSQIAQHLDVLNEKPNGYEDYCEYHTIGGFQAMWQLQKPHIPAVRGGSVFCFVSKGEMLPKEITVGEYTQEGFGVCSVYTLKELKDLNCVVKSDVMMRSEDGAALAVQHFRSMLLVYAAQEELKTFARELMDRHGMQMKELPIGRLRQMLRDSDSPKDLRRRVQTMKLSDVSSDNKGKKEKSEEFLNMIYGENDHCFGGIKKYTKKCIETRPDEAKANERIQRLFNEVEKDKEALGFMQRNWKLPAQIVLHAAHYAKRGAE